MTEHDLIDAERLAERRRGYVPPEWREEIDVLCDAIVKLVAEVRRQRNEGERAYERGYQRGRADGDSYARAAWA